ncbi:glycosyltransferase family 4 protein [Klebsiella pneumoniae]|uniref:glycosyltransferase family 4 protein n=1 Tax=Klebsiella pneumoniae complex TaxID=3390273 RepID=UPI0007CA3715|nr:glycosyltransferase family 4 protein [Klebsiella pneumoniae]SAR59964.1 lipopolysaccharide 1%2C2-N-acetylglucosaminetransferase [Klebsiella pneumoniae]
MNNKKKVLFVNHTSLMGGAEFCLYEYLLNSNLLKEEGVECGFLTFSPGHFLNKIEDGRIKKILVDFDSVLAKQKRKLNILSLFTLLFNAPRFIKNVRRIIKKYDVIYCNTLKSYIIISMACMFNKKKIILHLHDALSKRVFSTAVLKTIKLLSLINRPYIISNSEFSLNCYKHAGGYYQHEEVIPNGIICADNFNQGNTILSEKIIKILSLGRISPWKGQLNVLKAIRQLEHVELRIVGSPLFGEMDYHEELKSFVIENKLQNRVFFYDYTTELEPHFRWADILIHSSIEDEPFGRVIIEGLYHGKVVIVTDGGGATEIIKKKTGIGILVGKNKIEEIVYAIQEVDLNRDKYREAVIAVPDYIREEYDIIVISKKTDDFINEVINE